MLRNVTARSRHGSQALRLRRAQHPAQRAARGRDLIELLYCVLLSACQVTLLLCNACAMEALPLFLDELATPLTAILISVTAVRLELTNQLTS